ncbi:MAG: hypothetical protein KDI16_14865 [Halioglobus sp.]|nr:hypothetical protein [Halioglobus sp.]
MNLLQTRRQAIARHCAAMDARRRRIRRRAAAVTRGAGQVAARPATLAVAGLCGALAGYLHTGSAPSGGSALERPRKRAPGGGALQTLTHLATLLPAVLAGLDTLSGEPSQDRLAAASAAPSGASEAGDAR